MKKIYLLMIFLSISVSALYADWFMTLGYDYTFTGSNALLSSSGARTPYLNGEAGWLFDSGISASFKYDHIVLEDFEYSGENARVVAVMPALGFGYAVKFFDDKLLWWTGAYAGYAVSARLRLGVTDHKAGGFAPSFSTALYYDVKGQFFAGIELGFRILKVSYTDLAGNPSLDLSGIYAGISLRHVFEK